MKSGETHYLRFYDVNTGRFVADAHFDPGREEVDTALHVVLPHDATRSIAEAINEREFIGTLALPSQRLSWDAVWRADLGDIVESLDEIRALALDIAGNAVDGFSDAATTGTVEKQIAVIMSEASQSGLLSVDEKQAMASLIVASRQLASQSTSNVDPAANTHPMAQWRVENGVSESDMREWLNLAQDAPLPWSQDVLFTLVAHVQHRSDIAALAEWRNEAEEQHRDDPRTAFSAFFWRDSAITMPINQYAKIDDESSKLAERITAHDRSREAATNTSATTPEGPGL